MQDKGKDLRMIIRKQGLTEAEIVEQLLSDLDSKKRTRFKVRSIFMLTRWHDRCSSYKILTLKELLGSNRVDILRRKSFGHKSLKALEDSLAKLGLGLEMSKKDIESIFNPMSEKHRAVKAK